MRVLCLCCVCACGFPRGYVRGLRGERSSLPPPPIQPSPSPPGSFAPRPVRARATYLGHGRPGITCAVVAAGTSNAGQPRPSLAHSSFNRFLRPRRSLPSIAAHQALTQSHTHTRNRVILGNTPAGNDGGNHGHPPRDGYVLVCRIHPHPPSTRWPSACRLTVATARGTHASHPPHSPHMHTHSQGCPRTEERGDGGFRAGPVLACHGGRANLHHGDPHGWGEQRRVEPRIHCPLALRLGEVRGVSM